MIEPQSLEGVVVLGGPVHRDDRGSFSETFRASELAEAGCARPFVQENLVRTTRAGVLRGLHFQREPHAQDKLIQVLAGTIFDVVFDIRPGSPTLGEWLGLTLSVHQPRQLLAPRGFAHGYLTLSEECVVLYKTTAYYAREAEGGLRWDDPALGIDWPAPRGAISVNDRDKGWPPFAEAMASLKALT
jgi:dTDP-4-dehydrorhamnose 3,5-epimerase